MTRAKKGYFICSIVVMGLLAAMPRLHAATNDELLKRLEKTEKRVKELEGKLAEKERPISVIKEEEAVSPGVEERLTQLEDKSKFIDFLKGVEVHGFVDTSYIFNFETPEAPNARMNSLRVFDTEANGFMLNLTEINIEKPASKESPVGFRIDLDYGDDAEVFGAAGLGSTADEFDLQQAYIQVYLPWDIPFMNDLNVKAGKYVTLHGAEVIESVDNWNSSRSFLFGYAIPFTHTGVRASFRPFSDHDTTAYIGVVNGWDNVTDNNKGKTVEAQIATNLSEDFFLSIADVFGPEQAGSSSNYRNVLDVVAVYDVTDRLTLMANYDFGYEDDGAGIDDNAWWSGVAVYAMYELFDWWAIAGRGEYFRDRDGVRTGTGFTDVKLWETTLTNEFRIYENLIARLEYRFDNANKNVFRKNSSMDDYQNSITGEIILGF